MNPFSDVRSLLALRDAGKISVHELVTMYQQRLEKYSASLNCALEVFGDVDGAKVGQGSLRGVPFLVKDNICQQGRLTSAGSKILSTYKAPYAATVVQRLEQAGAVSIGRANCDEFAMGGSGEFSAYGSAKNPWDMSRSPGGSSSGSAAAVAAGLVPFALGTETGGSVRQPASFCGLVGLYPTYGRHSRYGVLAFTSSTDQVGAITRTVYDNALVSSLMSGNDPHDATSLPGAPVDYTKGLDGKLPAGLRVGVIRDGIEHAGVDPVVRQSFAAAITELENMGAKISYIDLPCLEYGIAVYFVMSRAEAASNLSRYDGTLYGSRVKEAKDLFDMYVQTRSAGFGTEVKRRILVGNYVLSAGHKDAFYVQALRVRQLIAQEFEAAFKDVDVLISPTVPTLPFTLGELTQDPIAMYLADYFMVPTNIIGTPGISIPCGFSPEGLPIGMQFLGPRLSEELLYKVAYAFEQHTQYFTKVPAGYE